MVFAMIFATSSVFGQQNQVRVPKGPNAYMVGDQNGVGLEVNGKLVVAKTYKDFQTDDKGTHFAVETKDGKYGVCDSKGVFIYKCTYYKAQITGGTIRLQTTASSEPKFYNTASPTTEVTVTKVDPNAFAPDIQENHRAAIAKAKEMSALDPFAAFEFKTNSRGWLELYVDGKKLFEARKWYLISSYDFYKKHKCFIFIVTDKVSGRGKDAYGLYGFGVKTVNGKKEVETSLILSYDYSHITPHPSGSPAVVCTTFSGATKYFDWFGYPIVPDKK